MAETPLSPESSLEPNSDYQEVAEPEQAFAAPAPEVSEVPTAPAEAQPADQPEGVASTIEVPALEGAAAASVGEGEGGEWELLVGKLNSWFGSDELLSQWQKIRGPLKGLAILIGVIVGLRLYASVVGSIDRIPVVSGLLELTGLIGLGQFGLTKMIKTQEREQVFANWKQRWQSFRGPN